MRTFLPCNVRRQAALPCINPEKRDDNWGMIRKSDEKPIIRGYARIPVLARHYAITLPRNEQDISWEGFTLSKSRRTLISIQASAQFLSKLFAYNLYA